MAKPLTWEITDHVCLVCLGRVLQRRDASDPPVVTVRCSSCGATGTGSPRSICWCGHKQKAAGGAQRFKCQPNAEPTPEFPSEIEVTELR